MKLPPPQRVNPVAEGDAEIEAAETEIADPGANQILNLRLSMARTEKPLGGQTRNLKPVKLLLLIDLLPPLPKLLLLLP